MITARRSTNFNFDSFASNTGTSNVGLLERQPELRAEQMINVAEEENLEQAKARMQRNLDKLLNYDRASESVIEDEIQHEQATVSAQEVASQEITISSLQSDEDIRPTSTTMQFGDGDLDQMYKEMNKQQTATKESYHLNAKGKFVVLLYSLAVAIILALIIINTSLLASVKNDNANLMATERQLQAEYAERMEAVGEISSNEHVESLAGQLGFIKR